MTIQLEGLTRQQRQIADLIWGCDTQDQVELLKQNLPPEYRRDAEVVHQLLIAAVFDDYEEITEDVQDLIIDISRG